MEGCCSFEVIVGRVCGCNAKDRKRNSEIVPLLSCNWALVVPPRANSFVFRQWLPLLSSLLLLRNRTKRFRQKFATFYFRAEIRRLKRHVCFLFGVLYNKWHIDHNFQKTKNRGPVSGAGGCKDLSCGKKRVGARGEYEHEQDRGNGTNMLQKTI